MKASVTKVATYDAATVHAQVSHLDALPLVERFYAREKIKADAQRAWVRGGRQGINPLVFF